MASKRGQGMRRLCAKQRKGMRQFQASTFRSFWQLAGLGAIGHGGPMASKRGQGMASKANEDDVQ